VLLAALVAALLVTITAVVTAIVRTDSLADDISWPATGVAAVARGDDVALSPGADIPRPIASLAKIFTALVVLDRVPLDPGSSGPSFQLTAADVAFVSEEEATGGSTVSVREGDVVSTRELFEAMLIASSNNHARSLVAHVFGSEAAYLAAAQQWLTEHDFDDVAIADATGVSPQTRASAADMLSIARLAVNEPVIAEIGAMTQLRSSASGIPVESTNTMLGTLGIDGLKTGHTDAARYTMIFTAEVDSEKVLGVLLGSPSDAQRTTDVTRLLAHLRRD
jgi:D-alanyl-D-alanine carboxypeptidase (penicillin-binding protein 5/6)